MKLTMATDLTAEPAAGTDFCALLERQMRARDTYGLLDGLPAEQILDPFILTAERRRQLAIVADPDPKVIARIEAYYGALAALIEKECGLPAFPLVHLSSEGFGTVLITVGKLVVLNRSIRDAHRFGFASPTRMQEEADGRLAAARALIDTYRDVAEL